MISYKKILTLILAVTMVALVFCSCSGSKSDNDELILNEEEINSQYEELMNSSDGDKPELLPEDYNPVANNFTTVDFQITDTANEAAFNLPENSFATITATATNFRFFDYSIEAQTFDGSFKTAKGLSLANTVSDFLSVYKVAEASAVGYSAGNYSQYESAALSEYSRISFAFSSDNGQDYSLLGSDELKQILSVRDSLITAGTGIDEATIDQLLGSHQSVAVVDVVPADSTSLSEITIGRFDKVAPGGVPITIDPF